MIKMVASDLDGTLLIGGRQTLPEEIFPLVKELKKMGILTDFHQHPNPFQVDTRSSQSDKEQNPPILNRLQLPGKLNFPESQPRFLSEFPKETIHPGMFLSSSLRYNHI